MKTIAVAHTCFEQKFGIPRQSGLAPHATGQIIFEKEFSHPEAFRGLDQLSHIWILFKFHLAHEGKPTVRPPKLGGNIRQGVFATRSPFRPNNIGLSLVKLENIHFHQGHTILAISNHDLLDQTPILDIKPYHPNDIQQNAEFGWIKQNEKSAVKIIFDSKVKKRITPEFQDLICEVLSQDPRPAFHQNDSNKHYGMLLSGHDIQWCHKEDVILVTDILPNNGPQ